MYDHYQAAKEIIIRLRAEGFPDVAAQLEDDLADFSGTEIFMALRSHLMQFLQGCNACPSELESRICEWVKEINLALA